jgi:hypothetical protein
MVVIIPEKLDGQIAEFDAITNKPVSLTNGLNRYHYNNLIVVKSTTFRFFLIVYLYKIYQNPSLCPFVDSVDI